MDIEVTNTSKSLNTMDNSENIKSKRAKHIKKEQITLKSIIKTAVLIIAILSILFIVSAFLVVKFNIFGLGDKLIKEDAGQSYDSPYRNCWKKPDELYSRENNIIN